MATAVWQPWPRFLQKVKITGGPVMVAFWYHVCSHILFNSIVKDLPCVFTISHLVVILLIVMFLVYTYMYNGVSLVTPSEQQPPPTLHSATNTVSLHFTLCSDGDWSAYCTGGRRHAASIQALAEALQANRTPAAPSHRLVLSSFRQSWAHHSYKLSERSKAMSDLWFSEWKKMSVERWANSHIAQSDRSI